MIIFIFKKKNFLERRKTSQTKLLQNKKKNCSHADKICPDSKSKHLGDRE